jgi:Ca2+-transporting ATPase
VLESSDLLTVEAALTGESLPVTKTGDPLPADTPLAEHSNMLYQGTTVANGTARAVVVATGMHTELGRIGELAASVRQERTPLERRLDALGRRLVWLASGTGAVVSTLAALRGLPLGQSISWSWNPHCHADRRSAAHGPGCRKWTPKRSLPS